MIASMLATANNYFRNGENLSSRPLFLGLDVTILVKIVVFLFCSGIILWCLWDLWKGNDEDYDDTDFLDMLKDLTSQSYTLYSSCLDHVNELDDLPENTVHKIRCGSRRQRKPWRRQPPDSYVDSSSDYRPATKYDSEYDNEYDSFYDRASELETKRKPSFSSKRHVELPSDCKQCRSMHLCNNDGDRCVNIRVDTPESRNDTTTSSETEYSFWPLNIMGSSDSISSFTSWSSLSSTSNLSTLVSAISGMSERVHAPPLVSKDEPSSTNKGPAGRSELRQWRHGLEHSIRRRTIRRLWRRAILLVQVIVMLLPERLKQATKRIPERFFNVEEENHQPMVCDKISDPDQHHNAKTTLKKMNTTDISRVAINGQKDPKREKMETRTSSKPFGLKVCPGLVKTHRPPECLVHLFAYPKPRSFLIRMIGEETTDFLEMTLKQNRLQHLLGVRTLYSDSLGKKAAEEVTSVTLQPVELDFHGVETTFLPQEVRNRLESHVKHKVIKKQWALPKLALKCIKAFRAEAAKCQQRNKSIDKGNLMMDSNAETIFQPLITCQQPQGEIGPITVTSPGQETEGEKSLSATSTECDDYSTEESVCSSVLVIDIATRPDALEVSTADPRTKFEMELKSKCLEIILSMPQGRVPLKSLVKKLVRPGMRIPIPRVKHVLFMRKASIKLIEMNLKQKHLANVLGAPTIFSKSMELITPKETPQPKEVSEVEFELYCSKTLFIHKEIRDKLEFHIKCKKIQHLWGLPQLVQKSLDALIPKAPKMDHSRVFPKPKYDIEVMTSDLPFLTDEQKEALEGNVSKKKAHKNWGYPKRIMDSLKAFEVPEAVAKNLDKRHPPAASKAKDVPVEPKEPQTSKK